MKNTAVFLILILCVTGCSGGYSEALSAVERQMQSEARPERAYEMLCSIPEGSLRSKDDRALYGLLLTELLIKTRRPVESDSLIDASIRHFWHSGDRQHLADGYIYKCRLEYNKKNYHEAMESALMAIHISEDIADTLRMARSNDFMADIYNKVFNIEEELVHRRVASVLYKASGAQLNYYYCMIDIAIGLNECEKYEDGIELLDSISFINELGIPEMKEFYNISYAYPLYMLGDYQSAKNVLLGTDTTDYKYSANEYGLLTSIYLKENKLDSAIYWSNKAETYVDGDTLAILQSKYNLAKCQGAYEIALNINDEIDDCLNKRVFGMLNAGIDDVKADYHKKLHRKEYLKNKKLKFILVTSVGFCVLLTLILWLIYRMLLAQKSQELERKMLDMQHLINELRIKSKENCQLSEKLDHVQKVILHKENEIGEFSDKLKISEGKVSEFSMLTESLFYRQFEALNRLCDEYFEKRDSEKTRRSLYIDLENILNEMQSNKRIEELKRILNRCKNGLVDDFLRDFPDVKKEDLNFIIYNFAGFSPRAVCLLTGYTKTNFYTKRNRWRAKIANSNSRNKEEYLKNLGQVAER